MIKEVIISHHGGFVSHFLKKLNHDPTRMPNQPHDLYSVGTDLEIPIAFESGNIELVNGRFFNIEELKSNPGTVAIIVSEEFAALNNLNIGSVFTLYRYNTVQVDYDWQLGMLFENHEIPNA